MQIIKNLDRSKYSSIYKRVEKVAEERKEKENVSGSKTTSKNKLFQVDDKKEKTTPNLDVDYTDYKK